MQTITKKQARQFILLIHGLIGDYIFKGKDGAYSFVRQAGCIQYDPVDVCGKNAELTLQSRVKGFKKSMLQELLYQIPVPKVRIPDRVDRPLRYLKYVVLAVLVVGLPLLYRTGYGAGDPFFCYYVCPVGTLEGGVPHVLLNDTLRPALGWLFRWKMLLLILCIAASMVIYRPFCKYICPLGAFYAMFQRFSLLRIRVDSEACINCGACRGVCGMQVDPHVKPDSAECIRCGECMKACPVDALSFTAAGKALCGRNTGNKKAPEAP